MQELLADLDRSNSVLYLSKGILADGRPYYAYLAIQPSKYLAFRQAEKRGNLWLEDYGTILAASVGESEPDAETQGMMQALFGADTDFERQCENAFVEMVAESF